MAKKIRTDELAEKVIADYQEIGAAGPVAKKHGIGNTTVYRILDHAGVPRTGLHAHYDRVRKLPPKEELKNEYEAGASMNQLAKKYNCALGSVRDALDAAGAKKRKRGNTKRFVQEEDRRKIVELYKILKSQERVAAVMEFGQHTISRVLRKEGVSTKPIGSKHISWKGGRVSIGKYIGIWIDPKDEMHVMAQDGCYVMEHRLVMARHLGRPLESHETVHHINGDSKDNRLENLQLRQGKHGKGVVHRCCDCGSTNIEAIKLPKERN